MKLMFCVLALATYVVTRPIYTDFTMQDVQDMKAKAYGKFFEKHLDLKFFNLV